MAVLVVLVAPAQGVFWIVGAGFTQDVLRKLDEGQAPWMVGLVLIVFGAVTWGIVRPRTLGRLSRQRWFRRLAAPVQVMAVAVFVGCAIAYLRTGSLAVALIGGASYVGPMLALLIGAGYAVNAQSVSKWLLFYAGLAVVATSGVYLSFLGVDWRVLQDVGTGIFVYSPFTPGRAIRLPSGLLRTPEVAAWHAATGACVTMTLLIVKKARGASLIAGGMLTVLLSYAVVLTGRRKSIVLVGVFLVIVVGLLLGARRSRKTALRVAFTLAVAVVVASGQIAPMSEDVAVAVALEDRASGLQKESVARLLGSARGVLEALVSRGGLFGLGAGVATQGSQHAGGRDLGIRGLFNEGGLSRVALELGLVGVVTLGWILFRLGRFSLGVLKGSAFRAGEGSRLLACLFAIMISNGAVFLVAHQVFGDPFIYLMLGLFGGMFCGLAHEEELRKRELLSVSVRSSQLTGGDTGAVRDGRGFE